MTLYSIVFSSQTGNTKLLAQHLREIFPKKDCVYFGTPFPKARSAGLIFAGFWTDKGNCDLASADFLEELRNKQIFLFGTAGFGGSSAYFDAILSRVRARLDESNTLIGSYMCQGKMSSAIRRRYEAIAVTEPEKALPMLENFDRALSHPDSNDLKLLEQAASLSVRDL